MAPEQCISALGGWEGYELWGWRQERRGEGSWCVLRLRRVLARSAGIARVVHRYSGCKLTLSRSRCKTRE